MEGEYIALFQSMSELIGIIEDIQTFVISGEIGIQNIALNPRHFSSVISLHQKSMNIMNLALNLLNDNNVSV